VRTGILGGTFDPPHVGHLLVASDALEVLQLDRLLFIPNAVQPLKADRQMTPGADRLEMLRLAVGEDPRFGVDGIEVERGGVSYTVDTLAALTARAPDDYFFLVGSDVASSFAQWRAPARIASMATIAVMERETAEAEGSASTAVGAIRKAIGTEPGGRDPISVRSRRVDVSSTEIRERVRRGRALSGFVPAAVARYIAARGLYR
jgi:nicotinate-nucleotide adenylyltransferase